MKITYRNKSRRRTSRGGVRNELTPYTGPIRMPTGSGLDPRTVKQNLTLIYTATTNGSGELRDYVNTAGVSGALDWGTFAAGYEEYRVLGIRFEYHNSYNDAYVATRANFPGLVADSHVPVTSPPANVGDVGQFVNWKTFRSGAPCTHEWRARGVEELQYSNTNAALLNHGGIYWYINQLNAGTDYGQYVITFLVEFRGRR